MITACKHSCNLLNNFSEERVARTGIGGESYSVTFQIHLLVQEFTMIGYQLLKLIELGLIFAQKEVL